jgi:pimeloyl-ACP methyl ester carboxylesterase
LLAEFVVVPIGLFVVAPSIRVVFHPDRVPPNYTRRIGALLAIRPKTFIANCRDVVDLYSHVVRLSARYCDIRAPTEILTGDTDPIVAPAIHAFGFARDIPGARLTILPGAGHMPHWSHREDVVAAIERLAARSEHGLRAAE